MTHGRRRSADVRLGLWLITIGALLLAPVVGAAVGSLYQPNRYHQEAPLHVQGQ